MPGQKVAATFDVHKGSFLSAPTLGLHALLPLISIVTLQDLAK